MEISRVETEKKFLIHNKKSLFLWFHDSCKSFKYIDNKNIYFKQDIQGFNYKSCIVMQLHCKYKISYEIKEKIWYLIKSELVLVQNC